MARAANSVGRSGARPSPGARSVGARTLAALSVLAVALMVSGCGGGGASSAHTATQSNSTVAKSGPPLAPATSESGPQVVSASSVESCLARLGYKNDGTLPRKQLTSSNRHQVKNLDAVQALEYHVQGTGFEANGAPGEGEVYVDIATTVDEAVRVVGEARRRYAEPTPQEFVERNKGESHPTNYKIGSVRNVAYLAWTDTAVAVANVTRCAAL
jgi:hypothetical protein